MLFLRIFHRLILLVLGHGAGKHVLRLEWHPIPLSEIQSEKEVAEQVNQYVAYLLFNLHCKHTLKFNQLFFFCQSFHPPSHFIQIFHLWFEGSLLRKDKERTQF